MFPASYVSCITGTSNIFPLLTRNICTDRAPLTVWHGCSPSAYLFLGRFACPPFTQKSRVHLQLLPTSFRRAYVRTYYEKYMCTRSSTTWSTVEVIEHLAAHSKSIPFYESVIHTDPSNFFAGENVSTLCIVRYV